MAGHSKFANIKHRKGAQDAKRAKIFTRIGREIIVAVKAGGDDPSSNPRLRLAVAQARAANMPKDKIENAIKKGSGSTDTDNYEETRYEGYGPGGVAIVVEALTDNRNRTASEVRSTFSKHGGNLGENGSVSFMFDRIGYIEYDVTIGSEDDVMEAAIEAGATDVDSSSENHVIYCEPDELAIVRDALAKSFGDAPTAKLSWRANIQTPADEDKARSILNLIDKLEESDDVQEVISNIDIPEEVATKLAAE